MKIIKVGSAAKVPSEELEDLEFTKSIGEPKCKKSTRVLIENEDGSKAGIWECTPGRFVREVMKAEMVTFLTGHCIFHPEEGDPVEIRGGDVLYFPENSKGTWEIIETVRKAYLVYNLNKGSD